MGNRRSSRLTNRGRPAACLGALAVALFVGACSGGDDEDAGVVGRAQAPLTEEQACAAMAALKDGNTPEQLACSPSEREQYRVLLAQCTGLAANHYQAELESDIAASPVLPSLGASQLDAWRALGWGSRGQLRLSWDRARRSPEALELGVELTGADPLAARADLEARFAPELAAIFDMGPADELELEREGPLEGIGAPETVGYAWSYGRRHRGLPAFDDRYVLSIRRSEGCPTGWMAFVSAHWERDLGAVERAALVGADEAVALAKAHGDVPGGEPLEPPRLGFATLTTPPRLVYDFFLADEVGTRWGYRVAADDGEIVAASDQVAHWDGWLGISVGRPYDASAKVVRPLPNASVYEDAAVETSSTWCYPGQSIDRTVGDASATLGSTEWDGIYVDLFPADPADTSWVVDYRSYWWKDRSNRSSLVLPDFPAGTDHTFAQDTSFWRSRRGEVFYLLTYGAATYYFLNIQQYAPDSFSYYETGGSLCQSPQDAWDCCTGQSYGPCIYIECGGDMGASAPPSVERRFREIVFHEQNHELSWKAREPGNLCSGGECGEWEEGRADFGAIALSRYEHAHPDYLPSLTYPGSTARPIWAALYADQLLHAGVNETLRAVHKDLQLYDDNTIMVGSCTDQNADGFVVVEECPANSFYRRLLAADTVLYAGKLQSQHEISRVFHHHVTDADPGQAGVQGFPFADEMPNRLRRPPFAAVHETGGAWFSLVAGPEPGSGSLRFDKASDYDTLTFLARAEQYYIYTGILAPNVDTVLELLDPSGAEVVLASNDDCWQGTPSSCITYTFGSPGFYRVRVSPKAGSGTGPSKTYQLGLGMMNDDCGDTLANAAPLAPDGVYRNLAFSSGATDMDVVKVASSGNQTLRYHACSSSFTVRALLYNALGVLVDSASFASCAAAPRDFGVGQGVYFLRLGGSASGTYKVYARLTADIDVDSTAANAWTLTSDASTGRVLGTRFESAGDEDWFKFSAAAEGRSYTVETWGLGASLDTVIEIYAPSSTLFGRTGSELDKLPDTSGGQGLGHWMVRDDDGGIAWGGSRVAFITPAPGTYYVRVSDKSGAAGSYYLSFLDAGAELGWIQPP